MESSLLKGVFLLKKQGQTKISVSISIDEINDTNIRSLRTSDGTCRNILITGIQMFDDRTTVSTDHQKFNRRLVLMNIEGNLINKKHN